MASAKSSLCGAAGCGLRFLGRIMLGTVSDRSRIGNDVSPVFSQFLSDVVCSFCVAGAVFGEVGGWCLLLRALEMTFHLFSANFCQMLCAHFAWQAQYLVRLEGDACCSTHCKWRVICDVDQSWDLFCMAGAVFGEVGRWCLLLCLL